VQTNKAKHHTRTHPPKRNIHRDSMADAPQVVPADAPQVAPSTDPEVRHRKKSLVAINGPDGRSKILNLEELSNADAQLAAQFGYKPVFKREFGYLSTFSFAVSISGLFSTIMTTFVYPISAGGSAAAVWCWLISGAGCMCIAVSAPKNGRFGSFVVSPPSCSQF
jgi:hypothetical protein